MVEFLQGIEKLVENCSPCFSNIANFVCSYTCSPDQQSFMSFPTISQPDVSDEFSLPDDPTAAAIMRKRHPKASTRPYHTSSAHSFVESVDRVLVDSETVQSIVDSCRGVHYKNELVFDRLAGAPLTVYSFFQLLGNPVKNHHVQIPINFKPVLEQPKLQFAALRCNDVDPRTNSTCSCYDCEDNCKKLVFTEGPTEGLNQALGDEFILPGICAFVSLAFIIVSILFCYRLMTQKKLEPKTPETPHTPASAEDSLLGGPTLKSYSSTDQKGFWKNMDKKYWNENDYRIEAPGELTQ